MSIRRRIQRLEERFPKPGPPLPKIVHVVVQTREEVLALRAISDDRMDKLLRQFGDDVECVQAKELLALAAQQSEADQYAGSPTPNSSPGVPSSSTAK